MCPQECSVRIHCIWNDRRTWTLYASTIQAHFNMQEVSVVIRVQYVPFKVWWFNEAILQPWQPVDFIDQGFGADIDAYGNEKVRDATISQENQQHAKCLTSIAEVATQAKRLEEIDYELRRNELLNQSKDNQKRFEDEELVTSCVPLQTSRHRRIILESASWCILINWRQQNWRHSSLPVSQSSWRYLSSPTWKIQGEVNWLKRLNVELIIASQLHLGLEMKRADCWGSHICMMILTWLVQTSQPHLSAGLLFMAIVLK